MFLFLCLFSVLHCLGSNVNTKIPVTKQGKEELSFCNSKKHKSSLFELLLKKISQEQPHFEEGDNALPVKSSNIDVDDCFVASPEHNESKAEGRYRKADGLLYSDNYALLFLAHIIPPPPKE